MSLTPTQKKKVRSVMADYCRRAETHQIQWHYTQQRPFHGYMVEPEHLHYADCSGYVSLVFNWAMHKASVYLDDPLGSHYTGWGFTGTEHAWCNEHAKKITNGRFFVGDVAIYGHSYDGSHTTVCRKNGTAATSVWSSNGNEGSPNPVKLHYHPDPLLGVWRHPKLL